MSVVARPRSAVSPLRRRFVALSASACRPSIRWWPPIGPEEPMHCLRPAVVAADRARLCPGVSRAMSCMR